MPEPDIKLLPPPPAHFPSGQRIFILIFFIITLILATVFVWFQYTIARQPAPSRGAALGIDCADSDQGIDPMHQGTLTVTNHQTASSTIFSDQCFPSLDPNQHIVTEYTCDSTLPEGFRSIQVQCEERGAVCNEGRCVVLTSVTSTNQKTVASCQDTGEGTLKLKNTATQKITELKNTCLNLNYLNWNRCADTPSGFETIKLKCDDQLFGSRCFNGACQLPKFYCNDSDNGFDPRVKGVIIATEYRTHNEFVFSDRCASTSTLREAACVPPSVTASFPYTVTNVDCSQEIIDGRAGFCKRGFCQ